MTILFTDWPGPNASENLLFLRNAAALIRTNANRSTDPRVRARGEALAGRVFAMNTSTSLTDVIAELNEYVAIRDALGTDAYEAPPIDVIIPSAVITTRIGRGTGPESRQAPPPEADPALLAQELAQITGLFPHGDPLRSALATWNEWWDGITLASTNERMRARRLAAWARDRLVDMQARRSAEAAPAAPVRRPPPPADRPYTNGAGQAPPMEAAAPYSSSSFGEGLFKLWLGYQALRMLTKKGRR